MASTVPKRTNGSSNTDTQAQQQALKTLVHLASHAKDEGVRLDAARSILRYHGEGL